MLFLLQVNASFPGGHIVKPVFCSGDLLHDDNRRWGGDGGGGV